MVLPYKKSLFLVISIVAMFLFTATLSCRKEKGASITSLEDLKDKRIGVLTGSAGDLAARKRFPKAKFMDFTVAMDAALAIKANKTDAFVYDKSLLIRLVSNNPELTILPEPVSKVEIAAAFNKDNKDLHEQVNRVLQGFKDKCELQRLKAKWIDSSYKDPPLMPSAYEGHYEGVLRIGTFGRLEPFSFIYEGRLMGLDIELGMMIGRALNKKIEFVEMNFEGLIPALQAGKIDLALSNFNVTEERKKALLFSIPYVENDISALVKKAGPTSSGDKSKSKLNLRSIDDIKDKRIGVMIGSVHDVYVQRHYPQADVLHYKSMPDILLALKTGKIDVGLFNYHNLIEVHRQNPEFVQLGEPLFFNPVGVGFRKDDDALLRQFNNFLRDIKSKGILDDMKRRWVDTGSYEMPTVEHGKGRPLIVGIDTNKGLPFTSIRDNKIVGFDPELIERFAAYVGRELRFLDMDFGSLIPALKTGKVDMICSTIMITEERRQQISFSEPYLEIGAAVVTLKGNLADAGTETAQSSFISDIVNRFHNNFIKEKRYLLVIEGLETTIIISLFSALLGTLLAALVCYMRLSSISTLRLLARFYIDTLRGIPVLVLLLLVFYVVFASIDINPIIASIIAFGLNFAAYTAEIFRSGIERIDKGQREAGISLGFTRFQTFRYIIMPQLIRRILPVYNGELISLVKMTSIVGYIAVQDLTKASDIIRSRTFDAFFPLIMVALIYFGITWLMMYSLQRIEQATSYKRVKTKEAHR